LEQGNTETKAPESSKTAATPAQNLPVVLYLPNVNADGFVTKAAMTDGTAEHIVSLLTDNKALPDGCALLSFTPDGKGGAAADMNAAYGQAIGEGTTAEYLRLGCVVNTLLTFFELDEITITVEGGTAETGHEIYDYPLRFYENQTADFGDTPAAQGEYTENDLSGAIANLPRSDAADTIWNRLNGYWTATDNLFAGFVYQDGIPCITYGVWESEGLGLGELAGGTATGEYPAELTIRFPATEATAMDDARPERTVTVSVDTGGLDQDGKINIKIEGHGSGDWHTYAYGGATSDEAYRSVNP
jgi:hypothetical protein